MTIKIIDSRTKDGADPNDIFDQRHNIYNRVSEVDQAEAWNIMMSLDDLMAVKLEVALTEEMGSFDRMELWINPTAEHVKIWGIGELVTKRGINDEINRWRYVRNFDGYQWVRMQNYPGETVDQMDDRIRMAFNECKQVCGG